MKIFRVSVKGDPQLSTHCFVAASDKKSAKKSAPKGMDVAEWHICMGPRHGDIPGTDGRPSPRATQVIGGVPMCEGCVAQRTMSVEQRLDRLEELVIALKHDLSAHADDGHGYGSD